MFVRETGKVFGIGYRLVRSDRKRRDCGMLLTRAWLLLRCTREKRHAEKRRSNKRGEYKAHLVTPIRAGRAARIIVTFGRRRTFPLRLFPGDRSISARPVVENGAIQRVHFCAKSGRECFLENVILLNRAKL